MNKTENNPAEISSEIQGDGIERRQILKGLVLGAAGVAAAGALAGCLGDGTSTSSSVTNPEDNNSTGGSTQSSNEIGSFENPYTQDETGSYATGADTRNPQIFGSVISLSSFTTKTTRLWVEVMGSPAATGRMISEAASIGFDVLASEQICADGVTEIRIVDEDTKEILAARSLKSTYQPRFITTVTFGSTTRVAAYAYIEAKGGWWKGSVYSVSDLEQYNATTSGQSGAVGSLRRPLTRNNKGAISTVKTYKHQGHWQSVGTGGIRWILADFDGTTAQAHGDFTTGSHYFMGAYVFDQNDQLISNTAYVWSGNGNSGTTNSGKIAIENGTIGGTDWSHMNGTGTAIDVPYLTFAALPEGVTSLRIVWLCSLDGWWESRIGVV